MSIKTGGLFPNEYDQIIESFVFSYVMITFMA